MRAFTFPSRLYPVVDTLGDAGASHVAFAAAVLAAGVRFFQLRVKNVPTGQFVEIARDVRALAHASGAQLIVNDRTDIVRLIDADGVHLGQSDLAVSSARRELGADKIIGLSTHNLEQALAAAREGVADYIGFGPIFATTSKANPDPVQGLDGLRTVRRQVHLPIVAIGGITAAHMSEVFAAGADAVAMIAEIVRATDVTATVRTLLERAAAA